MTHYVELKDFKNNTEPSAFPPLKPGIEFNENIEIGGRIDSIRLCTASKSKRVLRYTLYVLTCFIMYLFNIWIPKLYILLTYNDSTEDDAEFVIIYGAAKNIEIVPLVRESTSAKTLKVFYYRLFKYYFEENKRLFCLAQFDIQSMSNNQIHDQLGRGLDQLQVHDHTVFYGKNQTDIAKKSVLDLFVSEILSPFYVFQVYSFIIWALDDYLAYASVILLFSFISITITLVETVQTRSKLRQMSFYEIPMTVLRPEAGVEKQYTVSSADLVPGDIIVIPEDVQMPCDAILLNGSCIMNEAMLTGESIPVIKSSLPYNNNLYNPKEDKQYTLFAGTKCIQTRYYKGNAVLGLVTLTGFTTVKGELIRTMLFPKPSDFKFYADAFKFMVILALMAVCGFLIDLPSFLNAAEDDPEMMELIFIKACEIVTVTVPPALPTCMQIGISVALTRLIKKNIYCISPNKINEVGKINVMCFDKTGTLTEDGLDLYGVRPITFDKKKEKLNFVKLVQDLDKLNPEIDMTFREAELQSYIALEGSLARNSLYASTKMFPCEQLLEIMATCHTLTYVNNKLIGDPLDIKMFESTKWSLEENQQQNYDLIVSAILKSPTPAKKNKDFKPKEVGIIRKFEFSSKLQRMSVVVKNLSEHDFKVHIKGSPEKIRELCRSESVPDNFHSILQKYTEDGYRVLACASRVISVNYKKIMEAKREDIEKNLTFVGFLIMENRLKSVTTETIDTLHSANIRTIMVTGDNVLTAISVARQCNIVGQNQRIFLGDINERDNRIIWKDFEFSTNQLNQELEPELDFGKLPLLMSPSSTAKKSLDASQDNMYVEMLALRTKSKSARNLSSSLKDSPPSHSLDNIESEDAPPTSSKPPQFKRQSTRRNSNIHTATPFYNMHDQENYCIAVTGKVFSLILQEAEIKKNLHYIHILDKLLKKCLVFARMHPDEKAMMIKQMMNDPQNIVGMCGDGANDVGALKTANMGVSLSEAEASIAAPFTSKIQDISCIPILLRQGRSALATSFQAFKYMALYSIIQFTTITILYYHLVELTNVHYYHIDIIIILFLSATMAMSDTNSELTTDTPTSRLISVQVLVSVMGSGFIQIVFQVFAYNLLTYQSWYDPKNEGFSDKIASPENTTLYLVSIYQYCFVALAFIVGKPFRKPFYTNIWFTISIVGLFIVNLLLTYNPFNWAIYDPELGIEVAVPADWIRKLTFLIIVNTMATMACERFLVKYATTKWKEYKTQKALNQH